MNEEWTKYPVYLLNKLIKQKIYLIGPENHHKIIFRFQIGALEEPYYIYIYKKNNKMLSFKLCLMMS